MKIKKQPIFIVGSGRSGSRMIYKLLSGLEHVEVYHEYLCTHIQPVAAKYFMGLLSKKAVKEEIMKLHGSSIFYSDAEYWVDSSNKLSWLIEPLYELFPNAKFINITRDGRKVVSSFFHKLAPEIYDDVSVSRMQDWLSNPTKFPEPPPEKKYWWNIPQKGQPFYKDFATFNQLQRIAYHWTEVNRVIGQSLKKIPQKQQFTIKLEDLVSKKAALKTFLKQFEIPFEDQYYDFMQTPQNVFVPMDFSLNDQEMEQFYEIAGGMMIKLGYTSKKVYEMKY
ncbi:MAG TPA: sulfotransferase [Patescibacteria group bacterium]|nr:sulfotransferase [Patescibacteria group bacterium]